MKLVSIVLFVSIIILSSGLSSCGTQIKSTDSREAITIDINQKGQGSSLELILHKGDSHNHPSFAVWAETMDEEFIQTLFVTKSIGTGIFGHGSIDPEKWDNKAGVQLRPASLPYWLHKRISDQEEFYLPSPQKPVVDNYTGATPLGNANLNLKADQKLPAKYRLLVEVNQPWDWNEYWTNTKLDNADYRSSCQPSLIFAVTIDQTKPNKTYVLNPIGHGHEAGENGDLYTDISTITTAKDIYKHIQIRIK